MKPNRFSEITLDGTDRPTRYFPVCVDHPNGQTHEKCCFVIYFCDTKYPEYYGLLTWVCESIAELMTLLNRFNDNDMTMAEDPNVECVLGRSAVLDKMDELGFDRDKESQAYMHMTDIAMDLPFREAPINLHEQP
jgi:hypothetical protein